MSDELTNLSNALAGAVETGGNSTVRVDARRRLSATGFIWSADGVIVTAHHVVQSDDAIHIGLPDGQSVDAELVGRDPATDLAVIRAKANGLTPATWVAADELAVGHLVLALGRPGQTVQAAWGIVSALGGEWRTPAGGQVDRYLRADLVMYPGFSGGPLVSSQGRLLGMNTSALLRGDHVAIPQATVRRVVETLLAHGHMRRGYLGVGVQTVRLSGPQAESLKQETGVLINSVDSDSPAERSGLFVGDILVTLDGQPIHNPDDLATLLQSQMAGRTVSARVVRGGQAQEMEITVGERA